MECSRGVGSCRVRDGESRLRMKKWKEAGTGGPDRGPDRGRVRGLCWGLGWGVCLLLAVELACAETVSPSRGDEGGKTWNGVVCVFFRRCTPWEVWITMMVWCGGGDFRANIDSAVPSGCP